MKLKKSFSKNITTIAIGTEFIILSVCFIFLFSYFINKEDKDFRMNSQKSTALANMYSKSKMKTNTLKYYAKSYSNGIIDFETFNKYMQSSNNNEFKIRNYYSVDNSVFVPPVPSFIKDLFHEKSQFLGIDNELVVYGENAIVVNTFEVDNIRLISTYNISKDPILKKNLKATSLNGFCFTNGERHSGWLTDGDFPEKCNLPGIDEYQFGVKPQFVVIENTIGIEGFSFVVSDAFYVNRNNRLLLFLAFIFIAKFLISNLLLLLGRKISAKYLDQVVKDTKDLSVKGHSGLVRGKNYKYKEFQSLMNTFLTVLDTRESVENQLIIARDKMEETVRLRTKELTKAVDRAEEANRSKMDFLASVSHEIRTPMNCIIGFCELIINEGKDLNDKSYAKRIIEESETLLHLINDILDHSKIESGKMTLELNRIHLSNFINNIISLGNPYNGSNMVKVSFVMGNELPTYIGADKVRLYQVVSNLYFNALKYTSRGSISIVVSLKERVDPDHNLIEFSVIDTGIGIPSDRISGIFDSYNQINGTLTREYRGTGLGLTITKKLVDLMKGSISVSSEPGVGSCFSVQIPVAVVEQKRPSKKALKRECVESDWKSIKVLIVEDYPTNRIVARKHLEAVGHTVFEVENGKQAAELCCKEKFDLILMDIQMPVMDGFTATHKIRREKGLNNETPIFAMTANGLQTVKDKCYESGMNNIILKPIRRKSFLSSIHSFLRGDVLV